MVIKGPDATAGSTFNLFKVMGIRAPVREATEVESSIAKPTANPVCKSVVKEPVALVKYAYKVTAVNEISPVIKPINKPTFTSLNKISRCF